MASRDNTPPSMAELCEYFEDRNGRIFKEEDDNGEERTGMKKVAIEKRIYHRNSRPSLQLQLAPQTNGSDHVYGRPVPTTPPFSPIYQSRFGRTLRLPLTPRSRSTSSSSGSSSPRSERLLRSPLTPKSTTSSPGYSCCSPTCYDLSPRSQLAPFTMHSEGNYLQECCCNISRAHEQTPECCHVLPQSQLLSPYSSYSVPSSPFSPIEAPKTGFSHLTLLRNSNMTPHVKPSTCTCSACYPQLQVNKPKSFSLPSSPRPPSEGQRQPRMVRSMPCSPSTPSTSLSPRVFMPHQPLLLRRRQQMKNENLLRKPEAELRSAEPGDHDDNDGKPRINFFP